MVNFGGKFRTCLELGGFNLSQHLVEAPAVRLEKLLVPFKLGAMVN